VGGALFTALFALFTLTPLHLLFAAFAAWGTSGFELFRSLALSAALLGAWVGGFCGIPMGALAGRWARRPQGALRAPGWMIGAIVTAYLSLPTFIYPSAKFAQEPFVKRVLTFVIMTALGALIGYAFSWIRRLVRRRSA
jgi:hypothetical protein